MRLLQNRLIDREACAALRTPSRAPLAFHQRLDGYAPTALHELPRLAGDLGLERLWVKDETERLGLPAFKMLGASWAVYRALCERLGSEPAPWEGLDQLAERFASLRPLTLVAATDGNHGRAVARLAARLGLAAEILVPGEMAPARIAALRGEGADVTIVDGSYDDAVRESAARAGARHLVISDTSWPGYERVPSDVVDGYATMLWEVEDELGARDEPGPDLVLVQIGVGALACAVVAHYRRDGLAEPPVILGVEPVDAACALALAEAGEPVTVPGPHRSAMAGLNCGEVALVARDALRLGIEGYAAIPDELADRAVRELARDGLEVGESGAAGLGGLLALQGQPDDPLSGYLAGARRVLLLATEGMTDPARWASSPSSPGAASGA